MPYEETLFNERLAEAIRNLTYGLDWDILAEARGTFADNPLEKPDVVIRRKEASPIVIENEYVPGSSLERDCRDRFGRQVTEMHGYAGGEVSIVFGVRTPNEFKQCSNSSEVDALLSAGTPLEYAAYSLKNTKWVRFPRNGFVGGDVRAFVEFMKPAALPDGEINTAADVLSECASDVAGILVAHDRDPAAQSFGASIGEMLRQPWPAFEKMPNTQREIRQFRADEEARKQTASMCAVILINALAFQQHLSNSPIDVEDVSVILEKSKSKTLTKSVMLAEWARVLRINYWPIFHIARRLLLLIPTKPARLVLERARFTADEIESAMRWHDVAGIVFQRMIADRKTLKTHYTLPASTILLANLGVHEDRNWSDASEVMRYHVADYACGTGGLLLAAYQRIRDLHRRAGGSPDDLHATMMEDSLTACDVMPAAVHLTSSLLSSAAPDRGFKGTRSILYPYGGRKLLDDQGDALTDELGQPLLVRDRKGNPEVDIGSLELLGLKSPIMQAVLPVGDQQVMGARGRMKPIEVDLAPASVDLVIMNPPFTRSTKTAKPPSDPVDQRNPAFTAFGISKEEQDAMAEKTKMLGSSTVSDGNAGFASSFAAIADNMVRPGGRIALVLPIAAMMGGSFEEDERGDGREITWQKFRNLLQSKYDELVVVSISQRALRDSAFSADSEYADCMVVGQKTEGVLGSNQVHFVNLKAAPRTSLEAHEVARSIRQAIKETSRVGMRSEIKVGEDVVGFVILEEFGRNAKLAAVRVADDGLYMRARLLCSGQLDLPQSAAVLEFPIVRERLFPRVGPLHKDISGPRERGPFTLERGRFPAADYPVLWNHVPKSDQSGARPQHQMLTEPDGRLGIRTGRDDEANTMWSKYATNLHVTQYFTFNANPTCAAWTDRKCLGGNAWPTLKAENGDQEKALCVWLNSTLGMIIYWIKSNRTQAGRGIVTVTALRNLPILDVRALSSDSLAAAVAIFEDLNEIVMRPASEAYRDEVRQELDQRLLTDVLGGDGRAVEQLAILRQQWCLEPSVMGTKKQ